MSKGLSAAPLTNAGAERSLAALERWAADSDRPVIVLTGAAKAGKTVVLDVLASRVERYFSVVYVSGSGSDPDQLSARILAAIGDATDGTPRLVLAREIERRTDRPLLLLLDDADTLPPRVELWLFDLARRSEGALRVVLALSDARLARELAEAFRAGTEIVSIGTSMGRAEAESYLQLVAARASESPPASLPRRVAGGAAPGPAPTAPPAARSEPRPADPAEPLPALASTAPSAPMSTPEWRSPSAAPSAAVSPRARDEAPSQAPRGAEPSGSVRKAPRLRWIAIAAALVLGFVAGLFVSELRDAAGPARVETAKVGAPADLPPVSAPTPTDPPAPALAPSSPSALATARAAADVSAPDAGANRMPLGGMSRGAPPNPLPPPVSPETTLPVGERAASAMAESAPIANARATDDARAPDPMAPDSITGAEAAIPVPVSVSIPAPVSIRIPKPATDPVPEMPTAATEDGVGEPRASADADEPAQTSERPAVSAAPPARPRVVKVQVHAEPGTEIRIGGRALGAAPVGAVDLPPGAHRLVVRMPDGREVERLVEVSGSRYEIQVR